MWGIKLAHSKCMMACVSWQHKLTVIARYASYRRPKQLGKSTQIKLNANNAQRLSMDFVFCVQRSRTLSRTHQIACWLL